MRLVRGRAIGAGGGGWLSMGGEHDVIDRHGDVGPGAAGRSQGVIVIEREAAEVCEAVGHPLHS